MNPWSDDTPENLPDDDLFDERGNALCPSCCGEVVDQPGNLCDACEEEDAYR